MTIAQHQARLGFNLLLVFVIAVLLILGDENLSMVAGGILLVWGAVAARHIANSSTFGPLHIPVSIGGLLMTWLFLSIVMAGLSVFIIPALILWDIYKILTL